MVRPRNINRKVAPKDIPDWEQEAFLSRTEVKKAAEAVTDLGEELTQMTVSQIKKLQLPIEVQDAILMLKGMDKGPAMKRQKLFLGRMLRHDEDVLIEIKTKLDEAEVKAKAQNAHFHRLEIWRERLLAGGDDALNEFMEQYTNADRSQIRTWIRNAQKEAAENKPPKSARALFQYLKGLEW